MELDGSSLRLNSYPDLPKISKDSEVLVTKLPNILQYETRPWNPEVYRYANYEETMNAFPDSVIRWREIIDENGEKKKQTNTRIVKWSDGSMDLMIGDKTIFGIEKQPNKIYHHLYMGINAGTSLASMKKLNERTTLNPVSPYAKLQQKHSLVQVQNEAINKKRVIVVGALKEDKRGSNTTQVLKRRTRRGPIRTSTPASLSKSFLHETEEEEEERSPPRDIGRYREDRRRRSRDEEPAREREFVRERDRERERESFRDRERERKKESSEEEDELFDEGSGEKGESEDDGDEVKLPNRILVSDDEDSE